MTHWSENSRRLALEEAAIYSLSDLEQFPSINTNVCLFWLPARSDQEPLLSVETGTKLADFCAKLPQDSTVCILATPRDAAALLPALEKTLHFQLWIAVKTSAESYSVEAGQLPERHLALLVLTRYSGSLKHTKTRIQYSYCPACGKTTKDYGGKKHTYHEYGTLMSDVWRDIECSLQNNIKPAVDRLRDLFGLENYHTLQVIDLRCCQELQPVLKAEAVRESALPLEWSPVAVPLDSQLLNADCLEALQSLPDSSIDFCFTDPPYNLQKKYDRWNDALETIEYFAWCDRWLSELYRVLKPGRTLAILNLPLWSVRHFQHLSSFMDFQAWIAWEALGFPVRMVMPAHYAILCFSKERPRPLPGLVEQERTAEQLDVSENHGQIRVRASNRISEHLAWEASTPSAGRLVAGCLDGSFTDPVTPLADGYCVRASCISQRRRAGKSDRAEINDLWSDIHRLKHNSRRVDHPCQLPPLLMRRLYALFTAPGEVVLDCFNGAGTSTLVAQQMQRRFIGVELSLQYHQLALKRHEQLTLGADPFGKTETTPNVKNSPVQRMPKQRYEVNKKTLQLDVKRIAHQLGRLPSRAEVKEMSRFPMEYFDQYFASWGEVCAAARTTGMSELPQIAAATGQTAFSLE